MTVVTVMMTTTMLMDDTDDKHNIAKAAIPKT